MEPPIVMLVIAVLLTFAFDYTNGFHDVSNIVATMIASGALQPRQAVLIAGIFEFLGPVLGGTAVANTMGKLLDLESVAHYTGGESAVVTIAMVAVLGAILWNLITWYFGLPSSSSHALIGGLVGATLMATRHAGSLKWGWHGFNLLHPHGVLGVMVALVASPLVGFVAGYVVQKSAMFVLLWATPRANTTLKRLQWITAAALAFSHGANDAQKSMGVITMVLLSGGVLTTFQVPLWVKTGCAIMITLGALSGGWRIMKTIGSGIFRLRPVHGFSSQFASAAVILGHALIGGPVSTTHVVSSTVMGVGTATRKRAVRWSKVREILVTWCITVPSTAAVAALLYLVVRPLVRLG